ncbi:MULTISPECIES: sodium:solute symporter family transporter [Sporosarcina]|uniref:sodium:solute symporter family transporter n=1 Tax=Sporosarcina TaxID=1569 RepID=UPI00129B4F07|nr:MULTISPECIES: sodium/solute symporter [Sporosarcina]GKV66910.1 sodium:solute symporter [Sporosarcina sp. NCCP-2331]GLB57205.1 sodium:solute symporter [Sporosarcina sp. NCCP-2378]
MTIIWSIIIVYMLAMVGIGFYAKTKIKDSADYHLAGRRLGPIMLAGTLAATEIGGGSSVGVASKAYGEWGLSAGWYVVSAGIAIILVSFVAPFMRRAMATTVPEVIGRRYGKSSQLIASILSIVASSALTAVQITATASIVHVLTGFDLKLAIIISGAIVVFYTFLGGMWSVTLTDFVQFFIIVIGFAIAVPFALSNAGGMEHVISQIPKEQLGFTKIGWGTILGFIVLYFMTFSTGQEAVQRYYAAKDEKTAIWGSIMCGGLMTLYAFIPAVLGLIALAAFPNIEENSALATVSVELLPPVIAGILLSGVISATLSSASGNLLAVASVYIKDVHTNIFKKELEDQAELKASRLIVVITGVGAIGISLFSQQIIPLLVFAFTIRSTGPFAAYLLGLLVERVTKNAGLASIIVGTVVGITWEILENPFGIMAVIMGSSASLITFLVVNQIELRRGVDIAPTAYPKE